MYENRKKELYIDNLIISDDDSTKLVYVYKIAQKSLWSINSNSKELQTLMKRIIPAPNTTLNLKESSDTTMIPIKIY